MPEPILDPVPEHLPGEPVQTAASSTRLVVYIPLATALLAAAFVASLPLWALHLVGVLIWGWPPICVRPGRVGFVLRQVWTADPPPPGLPVLIRGWLTVLIARAVVLIPVRGCAWHLDELLYGRRLNALRVEAPLIKISAARSGSTQLARYLEDDPHLVAPALLQFNFPYRWLWWLVRNTLGRVITPAQAQAIMERRLPAEFIKRHEVHPLRTDTFEAVFYVSQLKYLAAFLGPELFIRDFNLARPTPRDQAHWDQTFVPLFDRIARKVLLDAPLGPDGRRPRYYAKGHFLAAADALARRYPDARFLTVIRHPTPRLRSMINFLRVNPLGRVQGPPRFGWVGPGLATTEADYCRVEHDWFTRDDGVRRCVVRFRDYVDDLEGTMARVYRECLDIDPLPDDVPRAHAPRERTHYQVNRTLPQMGVDPVAFEAQLPEYIAWVNGETERG